MSAGLSYLLALTILLVNGAAAQNRSIKSRRPSPPQTTSNSSWYTLASPDSDFLIEFPLMPKREEDTDAPSGTSRSYFLVNGSVLYQFHYVDTGFNPTDYDANQLPPKFGRELIEQAQEKGSTILRSQLLRINVFEYELLSPRKGDPNKMLHWIERHVIRYGRQYTLSCGSTVPNQKVDASICQRYFNSFRVMRAPQPQ